MDNEQDKIEQTLFRLLDYRAEHNVDQDSLLIMLSLLNLMGLVNALNRGGSGAESSGGGNMQALLGPLLAIAATGMGRQSGGSPGQFNPAALLGLLGGLQGGGKNDLTGLLSMLGPLMGMGTPEPVQGVQPGEGKAKEQGPQPVQREINLDHKKKAAAVEKPAREPEGKTREGAKSAGKVEPNTGDAGVLEWKFGVS